MQTLYSRVVIVHGWFTRTANEQRNNIETFLKADPENFKLIYEAPTVILYEYVGKNATQVTQHFTVNGHREGNHIEYAGY